MVFLTITARARLEALERHYHDHGRDAAIIQMVEAVAMAAVRIDEQAGPFLPAPRPYPDLGFKWLKEGRC